MFNTNFRFPSGTDGGRFASTDKTRVPAAGNDIPAPTPAIVLQYARVFKDRHASDLMAEYTRFMLRSGRDNVALAQESSALDQVVDEVRVNMGATNRLKNRESLVSGELKDALEKVRITRAKIAMFDDQEIKNAQDLRALQGTHAAYQRQLQDLDSAARSHDSKAYRSAATVTRFFTAIEKNNHYLASSMQAVAHLESDLDRALRRRTPTSALYVALEDAQQTLSEFKHEDARLRRDYSHAASAQNAATDLASGVRQEIDQLEGRRSKVTGTIADLSYQADTLRRVQEELNSVLDKDLKAVKQADKEMSRFDSSKSELAAKAASLRAQGAVKSAEMNHLIEKIAETQEKLDKLVVKMGEELLDHLQREAERKQKKSSQRNDGGAGGSDRSHGTERAEAPRSTGPRGARPSRAQPAYGAGGGYPDEANDHPMPEEVPAFAPAKPPEPATLALPFPAAINMTTDKRMTGAEIEAVLLALGAGGLDNQALRAMRAAMKAYLDHGQELQFFTDKYKNVFSSSLGESGNTRINFAKLYAKLPAA